MSTAAPRSDDTPPETRDRPLPAFAARTVVESERAATLDPEPDTALPLRIMSDRERAHKDALLDASIEEQAAAKIAADEAAERAAIASSPALAAQLAEIVGEDRPPAPWPAPPDPAAFHGLAGDIVRAIEPATEADPVALLATILVIFGAIAAGPTLYQGGQQGTNLNVVLVGETATGRKGTALSNCAEVFGAAYPEWERIIVPGLGSGEGLIGHLKRHEKTEHRALVRETELGRLLAVMAREGSVLSPILRDAWDRVPMGRVLAREEDIVYRHHVGVLAHVTPIELRAKLTSVDAANGFGNRFLWLLVRRTKKIPFPESPVRLVAPLIEALRAAINDAQAPRELRWSMDGAMRWDAFYRGRPDRPRRGLLGAILAREEAQIARLALVYAVLDRAAEIDAPHLAAAEAIWSYAAASALYLFGDSTGDPLADEILRLLRLHRRLARTELRNETGVRDSSRMTAAIGVLVMAELATVEYAASGTQGGRRSEVVVLA